MADNTKFINTLVDIKTRTTQRTGKVKPRTMLLGHPVTHQIIVPPNEATQPGMMYVHTQDASGYQAVQQALNDGAVTTYDDTAYNLEVEVGYISGSPVLRILGLGPNALNQTGGASPQQIAQRRAMAVTPQQYQELRITPTTPPSLSINITGGAWRCANTEILTPSQVDWLDLTSNIPGTTGQARYVMIAVGTDSAGIATNGTAFESALEVDPTLHLPVTVNSEAAFVGWVRLENGQTTIEDEHIRPRPDLINVTGIVPLESGGAGVDVSDFVGVVFLNNGASYENRIVGQQVAPPTVNDDVSEGYVVWSWWLTANSAYVCTDNTNGAAVWVHVGRAMSTANVSNPPTDADLDSAFGTPATVGAGFSALLDDNGAGTNVYHVASNGTNWFYTLMTQAV